MNAGSKRDKLRAYRKMQKVQRRQKRRYRPVACNWITYFGLTALDEAVQLNRQSHNWEPLSNERSEKFERAFLALYRILNDEQKARCIANRISERQ